MNEAALIRIVYFLLLIPIHRLSLHWLWVQVCKTAGVTKQEIKEYRIENHQEINPQKKLYFWLVSKSSNPKKFKRLFTVYQFCTALSILCFSFAVFGCFTHAFDKVLDYIGIIMSGVPFVFGLAGVLYNMSNKEY